MILISLMLAATPAPIVRPAEVRPRQVVRSRPGAGAARSKRLAELEAVVKALPATASETRQAADPQGL